MKCPVCKEANPVTSERHYRDDDYRGKPRASLSCAIDSTEGRA